LGSNSKKYHFCEEISDLKQGATTFQNIQNSKFCDPLFLLTFHLHAEQHWQELQTQHEKLRRKMRIKKILKTTF